MSQKFYKCEHCGNIVEVIKDAGVPILCCGQKMKELVAGESDGAVEKHVPEYKVAGSVVHVNVGSIDHPMVDEHWIEWVSLETKEGVQRKHLKPGQAPSVSFVLNEGDEVVAVYAYCNLHGLWKA
ncbi:MAG: desulfoferrodoxin FeS4 iron-binding domain-containing protein [Lachnospiraceae bacterium]|nr:desulfoferrodoxin FeS4 iron-binding domain-containing protein [Lachnospiraceae bacterium]